MSSTDRKYSFRRKTAQKLRRSAAEFEIEELFCGTQFAQTLVKEPRKRFP